MVNMRRAWRNGNKYQGPGASEMYYVAFVPTSPNPSLVRRGFRSTRLTCCFVAFIVITSSVRGDEAVHRPYPGIVCRAEVRSDPPMRLFVADVDLANPKVHI